MNGWQLAPRLAWRYLMRRPGSLGPGSYLWGAALGIALSLVPLILVIEVSDGLIEGITRRYLEIGTYHLQVAAPPRTTGGVARSELTRALAAELSQALGAGVSAVPERQGLALLAGAGGRQVITVRAVPADLYANDAGLRRYLQLTAGQFRIDGARVLVAQPLARQLALEVGDRVRLVSALWRGEGRLLPKVSTLEVAGIFTTGYQDLDQSRVYVSYATGEQVLAADNTRDFVGIKVADPFRGGLQATAAELRRVLGAGYPIYTWRELERANLQSFDTSRALLILIMALIVAVAAVNVASATVTVALARRLEVAFLKAQGLPPAVVFASLTLGGLLTGVLGAAGGLAGGLAAALNVNELVGGLELVVTVLRDAGRWLLGPHRDVAAAPVTLIDRGFYLERIPIDVELPQMALVAGGTIALAILAAALPALRAARRRPLELLRRMAPP